MRTDTKAADRNEYFETLADMFDKHRETTDVVYEHEMKEQILSYIADHEERDFDLHYEDENGGYLGDGNFADDH